MGFCALLAAVSVALGAVGSHLLKNLLSPAKLDIFNKAGYYLMVHAISVLLLIVLKNNTILRISQAAIYIMFSGSLIFAISLYSVAFSELNAWEWLRFFGAVAPIGGIMMILAWLWVARDLFRSQNK